MYRLSEGKRQLKARARVFISGEVQGVFFRQQTYRVATSLHVNGWVRNTYDDRVEAVFEGEIGNVRKMLEFCKKGPPYARVTKVEIIWEEFVGEFEDFRVRY
ncbi:MAG TPA: acylphosphatase [Candidatus Bathyarchaeia archaeon]|nr:acylphosphatase [Candidatus Bathyarchaeia archaeon]